MDAEQYIRAAAVELADGRTHTRVSLDALRFAAWRLDRAVFDAAVVAMTRDERAALFPADDRSALTAELADAAIVLCGVPQHYLYLT